MNLERDDTFTIYKQFVIVALDYLPLKSSRDSSILTSVQD